MFPFTPEHVLIRSQLEFGTSETTGAEFIAMLVSVLSERPSTRFGTSISGGSRRSNAVKGDASIGSCALVNGASARISNLEVNLVVEALDQL